MILSKFANDLTSLQLTSKLWNTHHEPQHVEEAVNKSLADLQTDYLDLYLVRKHLSILL